MKIKREHHGLRQTALYSVWCNMRNRCYNERNPDYPNYGAKGVDVFEGWTSFFEFYEWSLSQGYKKGLELDRIDNDLGYYPTNCRYVTERQQVLNRRVFKNNKSGYKGISLFRNKWKATIGINGKTKYIGVCETIEEAVELRNQYIIDNQLQDLYGIQNIHDKE